MDFSKLKKAETLLNAGRMDEADKHLTRFTRSHPGSAQAWLMLASIYGQTGRYPEVAEACQKAIAIQPRHPMAYSLLGSACVLLKRNEEAVEHLQKAQALLPGDPNILNTLGTALYAVGKIDEAMEKYQAALRIDPNHPQPSFGLGNCALAQARWEDAIHSYRKAQQHMPGDFDTNMSLGKAYVNLGSLEEAAECFQHALTLKGHPALVLCELSRVKLLQGELDKALEYIEQSLELNPDAKDAKALQADIIYKTGDMQTAHEIIRKLVDEGYSSTRLVEVYGNLCRHFGECQEVIYMSESLLTQNNLKLNDTTTLHYSLGELYDKSDAYDAAYKHFEKANRIMPGKFDRRYYRNAITSLVEGYGADVIKSLPRSSSVDDRPVFIVGMPRSGTSLVEQILASHPHVFGAGELGDIKALASEILRDKGDQNTTCFRPIEPNTLNVLAERYSSRLDELAGNAIRVTDKMPSNFLWLGVIMQLFPSARIIHCRRDPRDSCLSIFFQQFTKSHAYANDLKDLAFYYRQYEYLMAHWHEVLDLPLLDVDYEELVVDLEDHARKMVNFLDLEWDSRCLDYYKSSRTTATASWDQVRQPVYTKSIGRWKHYRRHIAPLIAEFGEAATPRRNAVAAT